MASLCAPLASINSSRTQSGGVYPCHKTVDGPANCALRGARLTR